MDWRDQGALLSVRKHGETSAIIEVFTAERGLHAGVVRGGAGRKIAPALQPGAQLDLTWRARLEEHLGSFTIEPVKSRAAAVMGDRLALAALNAAAALLIFTLPEREAHPRLYARTIALFDMLGNDALWPFAYLKWELALLEEMGFGLDLSACAVTGATAGLTFVSPKSGRAVSEVGAGSFRDRLLPLPPCLTGKGEAPLSEIVEGLRTTGFFLENHLAPALGNKPPPQARRRLVEALQRHS